MKDQLISSSSSSFSEDEDDVQQLTINEHYAKAFQYRKEREELEKLKEKYGSDAETDDLNSDDSDSESDESEDEDGEELTPALDAAILRTLARIKARDPVIYDNGRNVFDEEHSQSRTLPAPSRKKKAKTDKPVTIQEQRLAAALEVAGSRSTSPDASSPPPPTHVAEQAALRAETIAAFHSGTAVQGADDTGDSVEEEGGLFTLREKTRDEVEREEAEYRAYLEREVGPLEKILDIGEEEKTVDDVRQQEEDEHVPSGEADSGKKKRKKKGGKVVEERQVTDREFLINYILHRGWIDRSARRIPTYKEATSVKDPDPPATTPSGAEVGADADGELLEDEEVFDEVAERFESSYNFRFEEPDAAHIPSFPRAVETVRRQTEHAERRHAARERRRERKEAEKAERREEVKRLKGLKAREVEAKLERIGKEGGWARSQALEALDLDADWDPEAHDQQMAAVLAETDGVGVGGEDEKPTWDDEIDIADIVPPSRIPDEASQVSAAKERKKAKKKERKKRMREDEGSAVDVDDMDADAPTHIGGGLDEVEWDGTDEMRKRVLDQYLEELYELEFNDMVAGMPTRFSYVPVAQASFGLSASEILLADDKDLNEYVGLKKLAPFRKQRSTWDAKRGERLREFKNKVSGRLGEADASRIAAEQQQQQLVDGEHKAKKRKGRKERMREKAVRALEEAEVVDMVAMDSPRQSNECTEEREEAPSEPVKKKRRRQKKAESSFKKGTE